MFIFSKIKTYIIGALALAIPIIYVMGKVVGANKEKNKILKDDLQASRSAQEDNEVSVETELDANVQVVAQAVASNTDVS